MKDYKEYIERDVAISVLRHLLTPNKSPAQREMLRIAGIGMQRIPAADVVPVVHGRWEVDEFGHFCSACREYAEEIERGEDLQLAPMLTPYAPTAARRWTANGRRARADNQR